MDAWKGRHPKLLDEERRHRWRKLEEETWKHAVAREWKRERSFDMYISQCASVMFDEAIPAACAVFR